MKNTVTVTIPFSFKGKEYQPSVVIDLDSYVQNNQTMDLIFHQVAKENGIGNFSYELEVLESSQPYFSNATGLASEFVSETRFDLDGFKQKFNKEDVLNILKEIAKNNLDINDLDGSPNIKNALNEAYNAGIASTSNNI